MDYKLVVTDAAHEDLDRTFSYLSHRLSNPTAAANLLKQVHSCYQQLKSFPFLYEQCQDVRLKLMGYRKVTVGNYILVYRPDEQTQTVYILRLFHGSRDYEKLLSEVICPNRVPVEDGTCQNSIFDPIGTWFDSPVRVYPIGTGSADRPVCH